MQKRDSSIVESLFVSFYLFCRGEIGTESAGNSADWQGLQIDFAGSLNAGIKDAFAAEQHILDTRN